MGPQRRDARSTDRPGCTGLARACPCLFGEAVFTLSSGSTGAQHGLSTVPGRKHSTDAPGLGVRAEVLGARRQNRTIVENDAEGAERVRFPPIVSHFQFNSHQTCLK